MQDRYAGDVGDFGKIGMLREIASTGLKVGVNWYLTYKPEEHGKGDGKYVGYLNDKAFKGCDDQLLESLRLIVAGERSVEAIERADLIHGASYYSEMLKGGNVSGFSRSSWHTKSLEVLGDSDIILCDPDNGLLVKSISLGSSKSDKYVTADEISTYYQAGKSVVFYNHRCREKEAVYLKRFDALRQRKELSGAKWKALKFARGSVRDYFFINQSNHVSQIEAAIQNITRGNWGRHFSILNI